MSNHPSKFEYPMKPYSESDLVNYSDSELPEVSEDRKRVIEQAAKKDAEEFLRKKSVDAWLQPGRRLPGFTPDMRECYDYCENAKSQLKMTDLEEREYVDAFTRACQLGYPPAEA